MKNDLSCEVVRDLLPSYIDGVASGETRNAIDRHLKECTDCRGVLRRMSEPEETDLPEEKEIDYLKKVRRAGRRRAVIVAAAAILLAAAAAFRLFYIGFPVGSEAVAAVVLVQDGTARVTGTLTSSGQSVCRVRTAKTGDESVNVQIYASLPLFSNDGDFTCEFPATEELSSISVNGLLLWENGEELNMLTSRLYVAKNPYVGDMSANAAIAGLLRIGNRVGSFTNELQTDTEPYGWTLRLEEPITEENEPDLRNDMRRCSCVLLAEIDNLGKVTWQYETPAGERSFSVSTEDASRLLGQDIKTCADSASGLQHLLQALGFIN